MCLFFHNNILYLVYEWYLQLYCFIPHDDVSRQDKRLNIYNVHVSSLCAHVQPFTLEREMAAGNPGLKKISYNIQYFSKNILKVC